MQMQNWKIKLSQEDMDDLIGWTVTLFTTVVLIYFFVSIKLETPPYPSDKKIVNLPQRLINNTQQANK